jgi:hypothetical protein
MAATGDALLDELLMDPGRPVRLAPALIGGANVDEPGVIALRPAQSGPPAPGVVATPRDAQHAAQGPQPELRPVGRDEVELHVWSSAK